MNIAGKFWARTPKATPKIMIYKANNVGRHCIDIAGVASSILATPTSLPLE